MGLKWRISYRKPVRKFVEKLDSVTRKRLHDFLEKRLIEQPDIRSLGIALRGAELPQLWRYRVGDYRIICEIRDHELVVLV